LAEAAALTPGDVDFMRGIVSPVIQWPGEPLKTETSRTPIPIPRELTLLLSAALQVGEGGDLRQQRARPTGRAVHYASLLIASGLDVKVVQARLRHASAKTTLDVYGHLWPDSDESARAAIASAIKARGEFLRTFCGLNADRGV
jgi:integrase